MIVQAIVEGHGEVEGVPALLRRLFLERGVHIDARKPIRTKRQLIIKPGELERAIELAARGCGPDGWILVLLDSDEDCPAELGPQLAQRVRTARADRRIAVVLAKVEFEAWLVAGAATLAGQRGLPEDLQAPDDPELIANPKAWLGERMRAGRGTAYSPTRDQAAFAARFDIVAARQSCPSFDKLCREVEMVCHG